MGGVDQQGGAFGNWKVSGPGEQRNVFAQLDPLGQVQAASVNGVGEKLDYSAAGKSLKTSVSVVSPGGASPASDEVDMAGNTTPICE